MQKRVTHSDVFQAIKDGDFKGTFSEDYKYFKFPTLETITSSGGKQTWSIKVFAFNEETGRVVKIKESWLKQPVKQPEKDIVGRYEVDSITTTGKKREGVVTTISTGKNLGKSNETTSVSQAIIDANGLWQKQKKKYNPERYLPMLLKTVGDTKSATILEEEFKKGIIVQPKLDGVRVIAHLKDGGVELYSRRGLIYSNLPQITNDIAMMLQEHPNVYLDGEIYIHGVKLQDISGIIRGMDHKDRGKLMFYVFDIFDPTKPDFNQTDRFELLKQLFKGKRYSHLKRVPIHVVHGQKEAEDYYKEYLEKGYEGVVYRRPMGIYIHSINDRRSNDVLKHKPSPTAEYKIVGFKAGMRGKDKGAIIFELQTQDGTKFTAVPSWTYDERYKVYKDLIEDPQKFKKDYENKFATIQYAILSKNGTPTQPKFIAVRDYE